LVDGLGVMEFGDEIKRDIIAGQGVVQPFDNWIPVVHFDLKPANVLLGDRNATQSWTPVCKITDFGMVRQVDENEQGNDIDEKKGMAQEMRHPRLLRRGELKIPSCSSSHII